MGISALIIDSREPDWVQQLTFSGLPTMVNALDQGDVMAATDDGKVILIERKTVDDLLNSIADGRLLNQAARMIDQTRWAYVVVTDLLRTNHEGMIMTDRGPTNWKLSSVEGLLLSIQEIGVFTLFCNGDSDYERCVLSIGQRSRHDDQVIMPAKFPRLLSPSEQVLASLPGVGWERVQALMKFAHNPAWAFVALTDSDSIIPGFPNGAKSKIRAVLGLKDEEQFAVVIDDCNREQLIKILQKDENHVPSGN